MLWLNYVFFLFVGIKHQRGRDTTNVMRQHLSLMNAQRSICAFNNSAFNSKSLKH